MTKPMREEVKELQACLEEYKHNAPWREYTLNICEAYLAQEEELKDLREALANQRRTLGKEIDDLFESLTCAQNIAVAEIERLESENQALKASMEAEYIERQAKHIQELAKENGALKAEIALLELEDDSDKWNELHLEEKYGDDEP